MGRKIEVVFQQDEFVPYYDYRLEEYDDDRFVAELARQRGDKMCGYYNKESPPRRDGDLYKRRRWNREQVIF